MDLSLLSRVEDLKEVEVKTEDYVVDVRLLRSGGDRGERVCLTLFVSTKVPVWRPEPAEPAEPAEPTPEERAEAAGEAAKQAVLKALT